MHMVSHYADCRFNMRVCRCFFLNLYSSRDQVFRPRLRSWTTSSSRAFMAIIFSVFSLMPKCRQNHSWYIGLLAYLLFLISGSKPNLGEKGWLLELPVMLCLPIFNSRFPIRLLLYHEVYLAQHLVAQWSKCGTSHEAHQSAFSSCCGKVRHTAYYVRCSTKIMAICIALFLSSTSAVQYWHTRCRQWNLENNWWLYLSSVT